jgi:hypothetical protein
VTVKVSEKIFVLKENINSIIGSTRIWKSSYYASWSNPFW